MSPTVLVMAASWQGLVRTARNIYDDEAIVIDVITVYMIYLKKKQLFDLPAAFRGGGGPQTHNQHFLSTRIYKTAY